MNSRKMIALALFIFASHGLAQADKIVDTPPGYYNFKSISIYDTKDIKRNFNLTAKNPGSIRRGDSVNASNTENEFRLREIQFPLAIASTDIVIHYYDFTTLGMEVGKGNQPTWNWRTTTKPLRRYSHFEKHAFKIDGSKLVFVESSKEITVEITYEKQPMHAFYIDRPEAMSHLDKKTKFLKVNPISQYAFFDVVDSDRSGVTKPGENLPAIVRIEAKQNHSRELHDFGLAIKGTATKTLYKDQSIVEHNLTWTMDLLKWRNPTGVSRDTMLEMLERYRQILEADQQQMAVILRAQIIGAQQPLAALKLHQNVTELKLQMVKEATLIITYGQDPGTPGPWQLIQ